MSVFKLIVAVMLQSLAAEAMAYVGPATIGGIGALVGVVVAVLITVGVIVVLPIRILYRKHKLKKKVVQDHPEAG